MAEFEIGDRVRIKVSCGPAWPGGWEAPKGTCGAVTAVWPTWDRYGVLLDGDPHQLSASFSKNEIEAES